MPFRWQGKYLLLTYPQSDFDLNELLHFLRSETRRAVFIRVTSERHECGTLHRHAFICFDKRFSFTNERRFDFRERHPNIKSRIDSPAGALAYCGNPAKPGYVDHVDWGDCPDFGATERKESRNELWGRLLDEATSPGEFLQLVRENAPYDFAVRYQQLDTMARAVYQRRPAYESEYTHEDFNLPDTIDQWMETEFDQEVCAAGRSDPTPSAYDRQSSIYLGVPIRDPAFLFSAKSLIHLLRLSSIFTRDRTVPYDRNASSSSATLVRERPAGQGPSGSTSTSRASSTWTNLTPKPTTSYSTTARSSGSPTTRVGSDAGGNSNARINSGPKKH